MNQVLLILSGLAFVCLVFSCLLWTMKSMSLPQTARILGYFLFFNLTVEVISKILWRQRMNNLPMLHVYTLGEFLLLSFFYWHLIGSKLFQGRHFASIVFFISCGIVLNTVFFQNIYEFNSYAKTLVQIAIISYSVLYFFNYKEGPETGTREYAFIRLINSAMLIYYCGSLFIFLFSNAFLNDSPAYTGLWVVNAFLNLVFQVMVLIGLWKVTLSRQKLSS